MKSRNGPCHKHILHSHCTPNSSSRNRPTYFHESDLQENSIGPEDCIKYKLCAPCQEYLIASSSPSIGVTREISHIRKSLAFLEVFPRKVGPHKTNPLVLEATLKILLIEILLNNVYHTSPACQIKNQRNRQTAQNAASKFGLYENLLLLDCIHTSMLGKDGMYSVLHSWVHSWLLLEMVKPHTHGKIPHRRI